jgi:hypothetical protein
VNSIVAADNTAPGPPAAFAQNIEIQAVFQCSILIVLLYSSKPVSSRRYQNLKPRTFTRLTGFPDRHTGNSQDSPGKE